MLKSAALFVNLNKKNASILSAEIKTELEKCGVNVTIFSFDGKPDNPPEGKWDVAFSLGGDGTVLYTARCLANYGVPIIPINLGTLGFLAEVNENDWLNVFQKWEKGGIIPSKRCMFNVSVIRNAQNVFDNFCLNDAVISCSGIAKLIKLQVQIENNNEQLNNDDQNDSGVVLGTYRSDGLIISTPTGSTAYSMASGGPILDPEMEAVIINPICPFALSNRPFVLTSRQIITVTVSEEKRKHDRRSGVILTIDGQDTFNLQCDDKIIVKQSQNYAKLIYPDKFAYYTALRKKLFWSGDNDA
ncbi:MAG: NAD(+)/NADH kinase [Treponema sp.]|nr:NAD(+)/NADH kinase [Treponema sp.]